MRRNHDARRTELPPRPREVTELTPRPHEATELTSRPHVATDLTPQPGEALELMPRPHEALELTPRPRDAHGTYMTSTRGAWYLHGDGARRVELTRRPPEAHGYLHGDGAGRMELTRRRRAARRLVLTREGAGRSALLLRWSRNDGGRPVLLCHCVTTKLACSWSASRAREFFTWRLGVSNSDM